MNRAAVVGVVVLLALSGCSGLSGATGVAPGVTEERVVNASALATAHSGVLANTSYTFTRNYSQRIEGGDYRYAVDHDTRVWVSGGGTFLYRHRGVVNNTEGTSRRVDGVWTNGTVSVTRAVDLDDDTVTHTRYRPPDPFPATNVTRSGIAGALEDATVVDTWNESGTEYGRLAANDSETRRIQARNGTAVTATTNRQATAIVREDGFVPRFEWSITGQRPLPAAVRDRSDAGIGRITDTTRIRFTDLGSTDVDRPSWVDDALAATEGLQPGQRSEPRPAAGTSSGEGHGPGQSR